MTTPYRFCLFGGLRCLDSQGSKYSFPGGFSSVLLVRLILAGERGCAREDIAAALWPNEDSTIARNRLRQTLLTLRRSLQALSSSDDEFIQLSRDSLRFSNSAAAVDTREFDAAIERGDWAGADRLYRGEFMPGYDDLVIRAERERLRLAHALALRSLIDAYEKCGELARAVECAARLASCEPEDEDSQLRLIRLLIASGHTGAARLRYRKLARVIRTESGQPISAAKRRVVRSWFAEANRTQPSPPESSNEVANSAQARSLPFFLTRFFGRRQEMAAIRSLIDAEGCRLVTLIGSGGSGKTRLAIEAAMGLQPLHPCFVPLSDITEAERIGDKIVTALRLPFDPKTPPLAQVIAALNGSETPTLLVLDNLEHLLGQRATRDTVLALLEHAPRLSILATSRQPLEVPGEREVVVDALPVPPAGSEIATDTLESYDSVALFADRMRTVRSEFKISDRNGSSIGSLCSKLDGLPLALEIVATWARTLTPAQMEAQLGQSDRRQAVLSSRSSHVALVQPRHASLQAAIDWSYHPLTEETQRFFRLLHVFRGGFTMDAAAVVCGEANALDLLASLQERSLILGTETQDGVRFRLLETLREYGREQCTESERETVIRRHAEYYLAFAERATPEMLRMDQSVWSLRICAEADNFRAALDAALLPERDPLPGLRLAGTLWRFWITYAQFSEGRSYLERFVARVPASDQAIPGRGKALFALGNVAYYMGDVAEGLSRSQECMDVPHLPEDALIVAHNQSWRGCMLFIAGQLEAALENTTRGLTLARSVGDDWEIAYALAHTGLQTFFTGDFETAFALCEESLAITRRLEEKWLFSLNCLVLSFYEQHVRGDNARAWERHALCVEGWQSLNDQWCIALANIWFASVLQRSGLTDDAVRLHRAALNSFDAMGDKQGIAFSQAGLAEALAVRGDYTTAATLWGMSDLTYEQIGVTLWPFLRPLREELVAQCQSALGADEFSHAYSRGRSLTAAEATQLALSTN